MNGQGRFANDGTFSVYELSHPLDSADDAHDFRLTVGDTVGVNGNVTLITGGAQAVTALGRGGDIVVAAPPVAVDVKPGSSTNPIQTQARGVIPVAILTTDSFNAATVDATTVCFGDAETPADRDCTEAHGTGHLTDVDAEGDADLLLHFETQETGIDGGDISACLTGKTTTSASIAGCDSIETSENPDERSRTKRAQFGRDDRSLIPAGLH